MPKWTEEQQLAIDKDKTNIIVSAGAGSGKTAVLTARVIRKLKNHVNINELIKFHKQSGKYCTLTAIQPEGRFGVLKVEDDLTVSNFQEKPKNEDAWINGGFFVCEPNIFDYIPDETNNSVIYTKELSTISVGVKPVKFYEEDTE